MRKSLGNFYFGVECKDIFIQHSLNTYLLSIYYVPGIILDIHDTAGNKTKIPPKKRLRSPPSGLMFVCLWGGT